MKDGGAAFPYEETPDGRVWNGMTLRDYIATHNMPELLKMSWEIQKSCVKEGHIFENFYKDGDGWIEVAAKLSYKAADAMLAEREKKQ